MFKLQHTPVLLVVMILVLAGCGGGAAPAIESPTPLPPGDAATGEKLFATSCATCHGSDGAGVRGLGKDLTSGEFVSSKTDDELVEFIKVGRPADDPLNTTGVTMLPKGGNLALTDQDLKDIVAYIRTLQK